MKKYLFILSCAALMMAAYACTKKDLWNRDTVIPSATVSGQVINNIDSSPIAGIKVLLGRQTSADGEFSYIDTVSTDTEGKFSYDVPYPNQLKLVIRDTARYMADTVLLEVKEGGALTVETLHTEPRFGVAAIKATVYDTETKEFVKGAKVALSVRENNKESYSIVDTLLTDDAGDVQFDGIAFPVFYKVTLAEHPLMYDLDSVESRLTVKEGAEQTLNTVVRFGYADYEVMVTDFYIPSMPISNQSFTVMLKGLADVDFHAVGDFTTDGTGKIALKEFIYPSFVKVIPKDLTTYAKESEEVSLIEANANTATTLGVKLNKPRYSTPVYTNLMVSELNTGDLSLAYPEDVVLNITTGDLYITDGNNGSNGNKIVKIDRFGVASIVLPPSEGGYADGPLATAKANNPWGLEIDEDGNLYFADANNSSGDAHRIRKITFDANGGGIVSTIAGTGSAGGEDGFGAAASFNRPAGLAMDKQSKYLYVSEFGGHRIRRIELATQNVELVVGDGSSGAAEGIGSAAKLAQPANGLAISPDGTKLFVGCNSSDNRLGVIDLTKNAGGFSYKFYGASGATNFDGGNKGRGIDIAPNGDIFVTTQQYNSVIKTDVNQTIGSAVFSRIAGTGATGTGNPRTNGTALEASMQGVLGICYNPYTGTWYVAEGDQSGTKVRVIRSADLPFAK